MLLLLLVNFVSRFRLGLMYISLLVSIRSNLIQVRGDLVVKSKLHPRSGSSLGTVEPHP